MPLAARLPCWGDLGRFEARYFSLPTLREYLAAACGVVYGLVAALSLAERGGAPGALDAEDALEF